MAATNFSQIRGDEAALRIQLRSTGATDLEFVSGAFLGSPDEKRLISMFLETTDGAAKSFEIRVEVFDPRFPSMSLAGAQITPARRVLEDIL